MFKILIISILVIIILLLLLRDNFQTVPTIKEQKQENKKAEKYLKEYEPILDHNLLNKAWNNNNTLESQDCSNCNKAPNWWYPNEKYDSKKIIEDNPWYGDRYNSVYNILGDVRLQHWQFQ